MKVSAFLTISAIGSVAFGAVMFLMPALAAGGLGLSLTPQTGSLLQGMGGLIIGLGAINFLARHFTDRGMLRVILLTNIITHTLGLLADVFGALNGALQIRQMAPVELTHLFIGIGSLIYLVRLRPQV
ncbi:MAG: hypothetical protein JWP78_1328 [Mucilaginibacter sp.]|nr:hypothetical protein [Mucilaginibacter sp.]